MKKIAIVTGTRAEYGLLKPLIRELSSHQEMILQLIVTGMHLSSKFGLTYKEIEEDGYTITKKVPDNLSGDTANDITKAVASALVGLEEAYEELKPDFLIVLGDRTEILAAATAAMIKGIPIGHIHGGETTEGAYDEAIRHAVTKMSYLHFTSTDVYRKRVIQLGESPNRVFNVGSIAIDSIRNIKLLDEKSFEESIGVKLKRKNILITFHPVTLENQTGGEQFKEILKSLDVLEDVLLIFTKPNSDKGGSVIIEMIDKYVTENHNKAISFTSMGQLRYLSALQYMDVVVGNSSSGIYEVPIFKKPTINIGDRQKGRLMPESVINCAPKSENITEALQLAFSGDFIKKTQNLKNIYGDGNTTSYIMKVLETAQIKSIKKTFHDL